MSETKRDDARRSWWKEQVKSKLYVRRFDAALVGGKLHLEYLVELGFPRERIFLGYDVVDNVYFRERAAAVRSQSDSARRSDQGIPSRPFFLAVTRLVKRKNVARLVEAFAAYRLQTGEDEAWDLAICGNGEEEPSVRRTIRDFQVGNQVHLPGFVSYQEIGDWYGLATAFVHPALNEPWGLVVNEACAAGLPVLGSRTVGACYELVKENENGFLFDPESTDDITRALVRMHRLGEGERRALGAESQRIVMRFQPERFATSLLNAINAAYAFRNLDLVGLSDADVH